MPAHAHDDSIKRLKRIEGQIRGIMQMVHDQRYCIDILVQISAARAALKRVEHSILGAHVQHCVSHALQTGSLTEKKQKLEELMTALMRAAD